MVHRIRFCIAVITFLFIAGITHSAGATHLIAAGSGVNLGITRILATAFQKENPEIKIEIPGSIGTKGAIAAAADRAIDIGLASRALRENEKQLGLVSIPYAKVAIVIGTNKLVGDENISSTEFLEVFKGNKTRWQDGHEIIVLSRERGDSGFLVLEKNIPGFKEVYDESQKENRWSLYFTDQEANKALENTPFALGVCDLGMIATEHLKINVLKFNNIPPTPETVGSGLYPLSRELIFIYPEEKLTPEMESFFNFVFSIKGASILKKYGYAPLQRP